MILVFGGFISLGVLGVSKRNHTSIRFYLDNGEIMYLSVEMTHSISDFEPLIRSSLNISTNYSMEFFIEG
jgi:hypothetical protein